MSDVIDVPNAYNSQTHLYGFEEYKKLYKQSIESPDEFWRKLAGELLSWDTKFSRTSYGDFEKGNVVWFPDGTLNACYNCVD